MDAGIVSGSVIAEKPTFMPFPKQRTLMTLVALKWLQYMGRLARENQLSSLYCALADGCIEVPVVDHQKPFERCLIVQRFAENFVKLPRSPSDCLPRSLALYFFLRGQGHAASHHLGVTLKPGLNMHAWVEMKDVPVLNDVLLEDYRVLNRI